MRELPYDPTMRVEDQRKWTMPAGAGSTETIFVPPDDFEPEKPAFLDIMRRGMMINAAKVRGIIDSVTGGDATAVIPRGFGGPPVEIRLPRYGRLDVPMPPVARSRP